MEYSQLIPLVFMGFIAFSILIMIFVLVSFLSMMSRVLVSIKLNPQPEPPKPWLPPEPAPEPPSDIPPKDEGLTLDDFIPDLTKPVKVVVKEDEHGSAVDVD